VPLFYSRSDFHLQVAITSHLDLNLCLSWEERWCNRINQNWSIQAWLCFWGQSLHWIESISISHHFQIVKEHWAGFKKPCQLYSQMDKHQTMLDRSEPILFAALIHLATDQLSTPNSQYAGKCLFIALTAFALFFVDRNTYGQLTTFDWPPLINHLWLTQ